MNLRVQTLLSALDHISAAYPDEPLNIVEVGCMFKENEGLSTYHIADYLAKRAKGDRFISIEYDQEHITSCQAIITRLNADLSQQIEYRHGHSLSLLPTVLADLGKIHLFSLDGGAHPEVCLAEFEHSASHLAPSGIILVDDAQDIAPSQAYHPPRPFGKATLILPMLILLNYLKHRTEFRAANTTATDQTGIPDAKLIQQCEHLSLPAINADHFTVIGNQHKILIYGDPAFIARAADLPTSNSSSRNSSQDTSQNKSSQPIKSEISTIDVSKSSKPTSLPQRLVSLIKGRDKV
jgi:hypothetical protein